MESEFSKQTSALKALKFIRTSIPILDKIGWLVGVCVGQPADPHWPNMHAAAAAALERLRPYCYVPKKMRKHRHGAFVALQCGVSHGGGQPMPKNLDNHPLNEKVLEELNSMPVFQRIAGYASGNVLTPTLWRYLDL